MQKEFFKNLVYNNLSQGMQFGARWLFNLALIALLSDSDFGIFAYVFALANILLAILPFGSPIYMIGYLKNNNKIQELTDSLAIVIVLSIISFVLYLVLLPFGIEHYHLLLYGIILGLIFALNSILYFYFKSLGAFVEEIKASLLSLVLILGFLGYNKFLNPNLRLEIIFFVLILINIVVTLYLFVFSKYLSFGAILRELLPSFKRMRSILHKRLFYGLQELMGVAYSQIGIFILFYFLADDRYGSFRKLFIIVAPVFLLSVTFSQVLLHHLKKYEIQEVIKEFRKYQKITIVGALLLMILLWIFKSFLLNYLGKLDVNPEMINLFFMVVLTIGIKFIFGNYEMLLVRLNKQHLRFWVMLIAVVVNILSIVILVPLLDLFGAILTDLITNFVVVIGMLVVSERTIKKLKLHGPI